MICTKCGSEQKEGGQVCTSCGENMSSDNQTTSQEENTERGGGKEYVLIGERRNIFSRRHRIQSILTKVTIDGQAVHIDLQKRKKKHILFDLKKDDVTNISFQTLSIMKWDDILRIILFMLSLIPTFGLGIFAIILSVQQTLCCHLKLVLKNGKIIKIPICQKADAVDILRELNYSPTEINQIENTKVDINNWRLRKRIINFVLFFVASCTIALGFKLFNEFALSEKTTQISNSNGSSNRNSNTSSSGNSSNTNSGNNHSSNNIGSSAQRFSLPLTVINHTGFDIWEMYASTANTSDWEEDVLSDYILYDGGEVTINFEFDENNLVWDFKICDSLGYYIEFYDVDFSECYEDGTVMLLEFDGEYGYYSFYPR